MRIDLYQDTPNGPQVLLNIVPSTPDNGSYQWIPANSGRSYGTYGLRIQVSLVGDNSVIDRAAEPFTIPEDGVSYYVNDASTANDEFTTAAGSNRNDGKLPAAPKPNPINVLRVYDLTSGSTLNVDTGTYPLIYTAVASSKPNIGLGTDRGFTFRGPTDPTKVAQLTTAIPNNASQTLVLLDNAGLMQIRSLTLNGGKYGIYATDATTGLDIQSITAHDQSQHGILIDGGSDFAVFRNITVYGHANGDGIDVLGGAGGTIQNLVSYSNRYGIYASNVATLNISGAQIYSNTAAGVHQEGGTTGTFDNVSSYGKRRRRRDPGHYHDRELGHLRQRGHRASTRSTAR